MRIWLLTSELPQEAAGGIARYVDNFARLLGVAGHEVVIIARTERAYDKLMAPGVRLIGIAPRYTRLHDSNPSGLPDDHPAYPYNILAYGPALSYHMAEEVLQLLHRLPPPDLIESQEYAALPYYLLQRKLTERTLLEKIPILVHLHNAAFEVARRNQEPRFRFPEYWVGQMEKFCLVAADALLSPSAALAHRMEQVLERPLDIAHIPHPLTVRPENVPTTVKRGQIVCVGRLQIQKGVLPLVKNCSRLWDAGEDFQLILVGDDADFLPKETTVGSFLKQRYARWIENGRLRLTGQLDHTAVLEYMRQAWAVIIPSLWENFPNTCLEAMGVGQVVLASHAGGQVEMIETEGINGFFFDWENPGDFTKKLQTVLTLSEERRSQIGQQAQARIRSYCDPETILPRRLRHYEAVIARHAPRRLFPTINSSPAERIPVEPRGEATTLARENEQANLLSVVVPFYNLGEYLRETLASIGAATYTPVEVVIVNDGSTEAQSVAVLEEIEQQGAGSVRVVHTENQGLAAARNVGAEAARGEFVAFVDADDLVEAEFFARAIDVLQRYDNVAVVYPWLRYFGGATEIWPTWNAEFPYLLGHNMVAALAVVRRSSFLQWARNNPDFEYNFEDYEGWVGLLEAGKLGVSLSAPLARYRVRAGSMYQSATRNQKLYLYDLLTQRHPETYQKWGMDLFNLQNANGPGYLWNYPALEIVGPPQDYVVALEQQRNKLRAEVQTLGKAWEDHVRFIAAQQSYIGDLEARCGELMTMVHADDIPLSSTNGISRRDYEIGGRLVGRIRRTWLAQRALRYPALKKALKKALGR